MYEIRSRIPSPRTLCILYVMVNLMKVNSTSTNVTIALMILFCVRMNVQVSEVKYGENTHWKAQLRMFCMLYRCSESSQQPWRGYSTPETESTYTIIAVWKIMISWWVEWSYCLESLPGLRLILTISHLYQSELRFYKTYLPSWSIELVRL